MDGDAGRLSGGGLSTPAPLRRFRHEVTRVFLSDARVPPEPDLENAVLTFVDERVGSMPPHLRLGIQAVEAMLLLRAPIGSRVRSAKRVRRWESSALPPVAQYAKLIRSLVLLAAYEMAPADDGVER